MFIGHFVPRHLRATRPLSPRLSLILFALVSPYGRLHPPETNSRRRAERSGVRRLFENRRPLGPSSYLSHLWTRRLLRLVEKQTRNQTFSRHSTSDHAFVRAWGGLDVVLCRSVDAGIAMAGTPEQLDPMQVLLGEQPPRRDAMRLSCTRGALLER